MRLDGSLILRRRRRDIGWRVLHQVKVGPLDILLHLNEHDWVHDPNAALMKLLLDDLKGIVERLPVGEDRRKSQLLESQA